MPRFVPAFVGLLTAILSACPAFAGRGSVDVEGLFPYVLPVKIVGRGYCTGVALTPRIVFTAAHCLYFDGALATSVLVYDRGSPFEKDAHSVPSASVDVPRPYRHANDALQAKGVDEKSIPGIYAGYDEYITASQDIGVIRLAEDLSLKVYAKSIFSLVPDNKVFALPLLKRRTTDMSLWDLAVLDKILKYRFPHGDKPFDLRPQRIVSVGYGQHPLRNEDCSSGKVDLVRRVNEDAIDSEESIARPSDFYVSIYWSVHSAASNWQKEECPGDSGGPLLFKADNNEYYIAGLLSGGNSSIGGGSSVFASLLQNLNFYYKEVATVPPYVPKPVPIAIGIDLADTQDGAKVKEVDVPSIASRAGIQEGDTILSHRGEEVSKLLIDQEWEQLLASDAGSVAINIRRKGQAMSIPVNFGHLN